MMIKKLLFFAIFSFSINTFALVKGFNQGWLKNNYGHQWLDVSYDQNYVHKLLKLNQTAGSDILRMWIYEGSSLQQFDVNHKTHEIKLKPEVLKNLKKFLTTARKYNTKISLAFLDGNAFKDISQNTQIRNFWWNVFNNKYNLQNHFYEQAILPIYNLVSNEFLDVVTQFDIVNEVNALAHFKMFKDSKASMSKFLCKTVEGSPAPVTASIGWGKAEEKFFSGILNESCLDFYDIHLYNDTGSIAYCSQFKKLANSGTQLQLGEFGQISKTYNSELQKSVTRNFLTNAQKCGFTSALAWRMDDTRDGFNAEARFSYFAFEKPREAIYIFRDFN
jgi:hypothetical protein